MNEDLPSVILEKTQHAAEAAAASIKLFESEAVHRLTAIEARLVSVEGRLAVLAAGQHTHEALLTQIANTQSVHSARLREIEWTLQGIDQKLTNILTKVTL